MDAIPNSIKAWLLLNPEYGVIFDPSSSDEEFDNALETHIEEALQWLENNANSLHGASEDSLSTTLAGHLSVRKLIDATRETNNKGHVDITITVLSSSRKRLGEAKIYKGYAYHEKGLQQLVERYSTGRERSGYIFCYVKAPDIKSKMADLQCECDLKRPFKQARGADLHKKKWAFVTTHEHASGEELRVIHYGINLHVVK